MGALRFVVWTPIWVLQVFGMSKSFRDNPVLGSPLLNRMGLHAARVCLAHLLNWLRATTLAPLVSQGHRAEFRRDGFVVIKNFLPTEDFAALEAQLRNCKGEVRECIQGDTLTHRILLDEHCLDLMPVCRVLVDNRRYERLLKYCAARLKRPLYYVQSIKNGHAAGTPDPQKTLHSDTFHPTMKAWFFVDDVDADRGPFTYVPGSHRLTWKRLKWEYWRSINCRNLTDGYSEKGSMRAEPFDLEVMGLPAPKVFEVPRNTLVVADTHGFHCRGAAVPGATRLEIWAYSRTNPFNPLPGLGLRVFNRLECMLAKRYWLWLDERARRRNTLSSWHPVPTDRMSGNS